MAQATQNPIRVNSSRRSSVIRNLVAWAGIVPFLIFVILFLFWPASSLITGSFQNQAGAFTLQNIIDLFTPSIMDAYMLSIQISLVTAIGGGIFGFMLAYAVIQGGLPRWVRTALTTFSGVASNFAGVPLAFAFIATLGHTGFLTALFADKLGIDIYNLGFNLYNFWGLALTYMYFQFPLMVLIMAPALDGLKREWREASENLGAGSYQYWRYIALPILWPSLLGSTILLFGNAFGAYATAYALTRTFNIVTVLIGDQISGNVLFNPNLGYALAFGMIVIMAISIGLYTWLQRRTARWLQ
ncbi:MAG: ABC transporter permease subunit [Chloroflexi bacterium]|nr:ABC transporter permease subunit [Chloroflexota bacterium]